MEAHENHAQNDATNNPIIIKMIKFGPIEQSKNCEVPALSPRFALPFATETARQAERMANPIAQVPISGEVVMC